MRARADADHLVATAAVVVVVVASRVSARLLSRSAAVLCCQLLWGCSGGWGSCTSCTYRMQKDSQRCTQSSASWRQHRQLRRSRHDRGLVSAAGRCAYRSCLAVHEQRRAAPSIAAAQRLAINAVRLLVHLTLLVGARIDKIIVISVVIGVPVRSPAVLILDAALLHLHAQRAQILRPNEMKHVKNTSFGSSNTTLSSLCVCVCVRTAVGARFCKKN